MTSASAALVLLFSGAALAVIAACGDDPEPAKGAEQSDSGAETPPPPPAVVEMSDAAAPAIPVDCPAGTVPETETNDSESEATSLGDRLGFCGALSPGSDVDYSTFTTPAGKKLALFQGVIDGQVDFDLIVNGKTVKPGDVSGYEAGTYLVKAFTKDGQPGKYRYRIQYEE